MNAIADRYRDKGVGAIFLYTHEAHPGEVYPHHTSMEQKLRHARDLRDKLGVTRPILVDVLDGACHRAYGSMPNMSWIFTRSGVAIYKSDWTDARSVENAIEYFLDVNERRRSGERLAPFQFDVQANSASLRVTTRLPVVCAVVYGTTHDYGQIATDTDMAGGGHSDHHPALTDLQSDTVYYARLQGVGPDGTLYRSEEYTFRTPPAVAGGDGAVNLASPQAGAHVVGVSSNYGGGSDDSSYGALRAVDGNPSTQWSSDGEGDEAWIEIELAAETHATRVGFWTRTMGSSAQIQSFQIVTDRGETIGPFDVADASRVYYFDTDFTARRLRFEVVTSSGGNTGAVEIEVYGEPQK